MLDWNHWGNLIVVAGLIVAFCIAYRFVRSRDARAWRLALVTLGGLPLLAYTMFSIAFEFGHPIAIARAAFICVVVLLPPSLFFLFIVTRKESLFNQYAASLDRLGLLRKRQLRIAGTQARHYPVEDTIRLERRVRSYLDRFSAVYGTLPTQTVNDFLASLHSSEPVPGASGDLVTGDMFSSFELKTVLPVFGASALMALGWMMVLPPLPLVPNSAALMVLAKGYHERAWYLWAAEPVLLPVAFAFLGAYFFSLQMLVKRFMRRDLGPNAYNAVSMRIILATLAVWVSVQCLPDSMISQRGTLLSLSFVVGAFPLIVWKLLANVFKSLPGITIVLPNLEGTAPLSQIDGLSVWHEARLDEEDIENVPNLATADIVDLMLSTKIAPNRIIDWCDQAILLSVMPPAPDHPSAQSIRNVLHDNGVRTASALVAATQPRDGNTTAVIDGFPDPAKHQALSLAGVVQLYANYPLIQNWLSTEPFFPPPIEAAQEQGKPGDGAVVQRVA